MGLPWAAASGFLFMQGPDCGRQHDVCHAGDRDGLFPDVGGSWFLPRLPGEIGMYMAMTGARLRPADCIYAEICDAYMPSDRHDDFIAELRAGADVDATSARLSEAPGDSALAEAREAIDGCFAGGSVEEILAALDADGSEWSAKQLGIMAEIAYGAKSRASPVARRCCRLRRLYDHGIPHGAVLYGRRRFLRRCSAVVVDKNVAQMVAGIVGDHRCGCVALLFAARRARLNLPGLRAGF